jgi:hypothetical protein
LKTNIPVVTHSFPDKEVAFALLQSTQQNKSIKLPDEKLNELIENWKNGTLNTFFNESFFTDEFGSSITFLLAAFDKLHSQTFPI